MRTQLMMIAFLSKNDAYLFTDRQMATKSCISFFPFPSRFVSVIQKFYLNHHT